MSRQYQIPGDLGINETGSRAFQIPGGGGVQETSDVTPSLSLSGPSSGVVNVESTNFTVSYNNPGVDVEFTPTASNGNGSFSPSSLTLTAASPVQTFTYTPTNTGSRDIGGTNDGGLADPATVAYDSTAGTIDLTDITAGRIYQRVAVDSGPVPFSGTYTGSPDTIEIKVVNDADDSTALDWTPLSSPSISGGNWSGVIDEVPAGGPYNFLARQKDAGGLVLVTSSQSSNIWFMGILVACLGQSNMDHMFTISSSPPVSDTSTRMHTAAGWATVTGNGAIRLANLLKTATGLPIGLLAYASSGTSMSTWLNLTAGQPYPLFIVGLTAVGGDCEFVLWHQGESDAQAATAKATYKSGLDTIYSRIRTATGRSTSTLKFGVALIATTTDGTCTDASTDAIRQGLLEWSRETTGGLLIASSVDIPLVDAFHYSAASYERLARRYAQSVLHQLEIVSFGGGGPRISHATRKSGSADIRLVVAQAGGSSLKETDGSTDGGALTGFEVTDDDFATTLTISSTAFSGNNVVLALSAVPDDLDTVKVRYQYGKAPDFSNVVYDNTTPQSDTIGLPLLPGSLTTQYGTNPICGLIRTGHSRSIGGLAMIG